MVSVLVGLGVVAVVGLAVLVLRRRGQGSGPAIDPFTLGEPWRRHVTAAQSAQRRYVATARSTPSGPLHDRLAQIELQVQQAVQECFTIARHGDDLDDTLGRFRVASLQQQFQATADDATRTSLQSQLESAGRIRAQRDATDSELRLLTTRMGELVAQAAEVSVGTDTTELIGTGVGDVVTQLEALRLALDDVNATGRPTTSP
jgi:hypothetical protein